MFVLNILFVLFCATSIRGETVVCDRADSECLTKAISQHYPMFIAGSEGLWNSSNTLTDPSIEGSTTDLTYKFTDVKLSPLENGTVELFELEDSKFRYNLKYAQLRGEGYYQLDGKIGTVGVQGEGYVTVDLNDYHIDISGIYETSTAEDGKEYLVVKNYTVESKSDSEVVFDFGTTLIEGDAEKSAEAAAELNENWSVTHETTTKPCLVVLVAHLMENAGGFLKNTSLDELFSYEA